MDKRNLSDLFRDRLKILLQRSDLNQSAFAAAVGIDRSALSQLLSGASTRLPRAETLLNIAAEHKVSLDWLLGLDSSVTVPVRPRTACAMAWASFSFHRRSARRSGSRAPSAGAPSRTMTSRMMRNISFCRCASVRPARMSALIQISPDARVPPRNRSAGCFSSKPAR